MKDVLLEKQLEKFSGEKITIRPSSVDTFTNCPRQWAMVFLGGENSIPGARAAIGTAVHAAVEAEWQLAIATKQKDFNITAMSDVVEGSLRLADLDGLQYDYEENIDTAIATAVTGVEAFKEDILPFTDIPTKVEERYSMPVENPIVKRVSGTVDYIAPGVIADVKTSKRKPVVQSFVVQQSLYKLLAEHNGCKVDKSLIQGVIFNKKSTSGTVLELIPNVPRAKFLVNSILDTMTVYNEQKVSPSLLFRGNPKYYLCSDKYCKFHSTCPYVNGLK